MQDKRTTSSHEDLEERMYQMRLAFEAEMKDTKKANEAKIKEIGKGWEWARSFYKNYNYL